MRSISVVFMLVVVVAALTAHTSALLNNSAFYQTHTLTGNTTWGANQTNYQIELNIYSGSGTSSGNVCYLNDHAEQFSPPYYDDIAFTSSDGETLLDFWIVNQSSNATYTKAIIEIPTIYMTGDTTLYVYYRNTTITGASNGSATFPFFDNFGQWEHIGKVMEGTAGTWDAYAIGEQSVIYEGDPQILTSYENVFKMWYAGYNVTTGNYGIGYAESPDGISWTKYGSNPIISTGDHRTGVVKYGSTYYLYASTEGDTQINVYTSSNGLSFTAQGTAISKGAGGAWDDGYVANCAPWVEGSTFYMLYDGRAAGSTPWKQGLATSNDGITWTKDPNNPVITHATESYGGSSNPYKTGAGAYYVWLQRAPTYTNLPTDIYRFTTSNISADWTADLSPAIPRSTSDEGVATAVGQVADPWVVEVNGKTFMYCDAAPDGSTGSTGHINLYLMNKPQSYIITTKEDGIDTTKWTVTSNAALANKWQQQGGIFTLYTTSTGTVAYLTSATTSSTLNTSMVQYLMSDHSGVLSVYEDAGLRDAGATNFIEHHLAYPTGAGQGGYMAQQAGGSPTYTAFSGWSADVYHLQEIWRKTDRSYSTVDGANAVEVSATYPTGALPIKNFVLAAGGGAGRIDFDYAYIKNKNTIEPTHGSWGDEEPTQGCTAAFSGTPLTGSVPLTVQFTDASTTSGTITDWMWYFGDTATSEDQSPAHTYTTSGTYDVKLYIEDSYGTSDWENKTAYVTVGNVTPTPTPTPTTTTTTVTPTATGNGTPPVQAPAQPGRISPLGFVLLAGTDFALVFYTWIDNANRNYFHIFACIAAVIVSFLCGSFLITGYVTEDFVVTNTDVSVNSSVLSTYQVHQAQIIDAGFGYFFLFIGVVMLIIGVLAGIEAVREMSEGVDFE